MQKLWLKNFEFHINPSTWNTAQDLIQAGAVQQLQEVEKHFWVSTVQDEDSRFEVELMITPHKIKAFTCECWTQGRRLMCPHIAATLFKVRQFLDQKMESRKSKPADEKNEEGGRLTIQNILENTSAEELNGFVRAYARQDRDFALALKTWFAGHVNGPGNPFLLLLDAALPRHGGTRLLREPEIRRLRKTLDELESQMASAAEHGHAHTVFQVASAILQKIPPMVGKAELAKHDQFIDHCATALRRLTQINTEHASPELRESVRNFIFDFAVQGHLPENLERETIDYLSKAAGADDIMFTRIRELFDQSPEPAPRFNLHLFLAALSQKGMPEAVTRVLDTLGDAPITVRDAIVSMYYLQQWPAVMHAGEHFLSRQIFNAGQRREIEDLVLLSAEKADDRPRQMQYLRKRYLQTGRPEAVKRLKLLSGKKWTTERRQLQQDMEQAGLQTQLAALLAEEGDLDALAELLSRQDDLTMVHDYEGLFLPERSAFVRERYMTVLGNFLQDHFGRPASGYVREELGSLLQKKQAELVADIVTSLAGQFADRPSLPEELAELFPKSKRAALFPQG